MITRYARAALFASALPATAFAQEPVEQGEENRPDVTPAFAAQTDAPAQDSGFTLERTDVATGLAFPWAVTVLPGEAGYLVTEQPGDLRHIGRDGTVSEPITGVPEVLFERQGGLLDVALAPDFEETRHLYLTYAHPMGANMSGTAAVRATLSEDHGALTDVTEIFVQQPPSPSAMHYGSRVVPTPDGTVFVTTGEHFTRAERSLSQELGSTYGKIVRVTPEGEVPDGNPFADRDGARDEIWTLGHRNVQSAALHPETGALWAIEHGPAGGDELNLIEAGANYGWPVVSYGVNYNGSEVGSGEARHEPEFTEPRYYWDPVIAPGGMVIYEGEMFGDWSGDVLVGGLVSRSLVRLDLDGDTVAGEERLAQGIGRVRDVAIDHDGSILVVIDDENGSLIRLGRP
jgi:glucose/arabinose dehydrogenase